MPNYIQGYFKPRNPEKYKGDVNKIYYRSSWEKKFFAYLDQRSNILEWSSEEVVIPYVSPLDGKYHRYFVDVWMKYKDGDEGIKEKLIEIKPLKETKEPNLPPSGRKTKRYLREAQTYAVNYAKWEAAQKYAKKYGMEFQVVTEKTLGIKK